MMIDIFELPVIDGHCHPFGPHGEVSVEAFTDLVSFPGGSLAYMVEAGLNEDDALRQELQRLRRNPVYFRHLVTQMAELLGCGPELEQVVAARNEAVRAGEGAYVRRLFGACGLVGLVPDMGYPQPPLDVAEFRRHVPASIAPVFRIEPLIVELVLARLDWPEFRQRFEEALSQALGRQGYCALKSVIAYRTGLDVSPDNRSEHRGRSAYDALLRRSPETLGPLLGPTQVAPDLKQLREFLLCRAMELCLEYGAPMQLHTGIGDHEINLGLCRPSLLMDLLRVPAFRACRVVLVHGGYPYQAEAGYMANVLPRVYCDVSEGVPFSGGAARRIYAEMLEMAPLHKVMYGSDGLAVPETYYVGAKLGKRALALALDDLVEGGLLSTAEAERAASMILAENARALYRLE
jgi:hypothetical protein